MNIVITGTHKGIGRQLAEHYLQAGHCVFGCSRSESDLEHPNYRHFLVDVSDEKQVMDFSGKVKKEVGFVDVLINNAGIASMNHFIMTPIDTAKRLMDVNYFGTVNCIRSFINLLKKSQHPRVVNFSTVAVPLSLDGELAYSSSKAAIENLTRVLSKEISNFGITVNSIGPTPIKTDLIAKVSEEKLQRILDAQAIHRFGELRDVINVIDFYINPASDFITGQVIYLGGVTR